jgi:hypothetical protein
MMTMCLLLATLSAAPDAGAWQVVHTTHVRELASTRDAAVRARVVVDNLTTGQQSRSFERLELTLADGGTTPALDAFVARANDSLDDEVRARAETALRDGEWFGTERVEFTIALNRAKWLELRRCTSGIGAYPWTECENLRVRTDTGQAWSWADAVRVDARAAFLGECSRALKTASAQERASIVEQGSGDEVDALDLAPTECTWALIDRGRLENDGLVIPIGHPPHALQALGWSLVLPRELLQRFVSKTGPLGHLAKKK